MAVERRKTIVWKTPEESDMLKDIMAVKIVPDDAGNTFLSNPLDICLLEYAEWLIENSVYGLVKPERRLIDGLPAWTADGGFIIKYVWNIKSGEWEILIGYDSVYMD